MQLGLSVLAITCSVMMKLLLELQGKADENYMPACQAGALATVASIA